MAFVIMPRLPSEPNRIFCGLNPIDARAKGSTCSIIPFGEIMVTFSTISSMLPYRFFFIPLALVAIHPPKVESSTLSGSWPTQYPRSPSQDSRSDPVIPA